MDTLPYKRLMFVIPSLECGGAERQLACLCSPLEELGWKVEVCTLRLGMHATQIRNSSAEIRRIKHASNYDPRILTQLICLMQVFRPTVVHTWVQMADIVGGLAALVTRCPWVMSERTSMLAPSGSPAKRWLRARLAHLADGVTANSRDGSKYWAERISPTKCFHIPNAVSTPRIANLRLPIDDDPRPMVVVVGRLSREKNVSAILNAATFDECGYPYQLAILGDGVCKDTLQQQIRRCGLDHKVTLRGQIDSIGDWMAKATLFVSASLTEGMPNAVLEAVAANLPLVLSDIPAHRALFSDDQAVFVEASDPASIAEGIRTLLRSPSKCAAMTSRARSVIDNLTVESVAARYDEVYLKVAASRKR